MPRVVESPGTKVLNFFSGAPLSVAALVLGLATDIVRARRATTPAAQATVAASVLGKVKKAAKKPQARAAVAAPAAPKKKARKRVRPSRAKVQRPPADVVDQDDQDDSAQIEDLES